MFVSGDYDVTVRVFARHENLIILRELLFVFHKAKENDSFVLILLETPLFV